MNRFISYFIAFRIRRYSCELIIANICIAKKLNLNYFHFDIMRLLTPTKIFGLCDLYTIISKKIKNTFCQELRQESPLPRKY